VLLGLRVAFLERGAVHTVTLSTSIVALVEPERRTRRVRRPFRASRHVRASYQLPPEVADALANAIAGFRNRTDTWHLATFLAEVWGSPSRVGESFPVDRRKVAQIKSLDMTVDRVRGALEKLELVGFLDRAIAVGRTHHQSTDGRLHRNAVQYRFGAHYGRMLIKGHKARIAARTHDLQKRVARTLEGRVLPCLKSPKQPYPVDRVLSLGDSRNTARPDTTQPRKPHQEAAGDRRVVEQRAGFREPMAHDPSRMERGLAEILAGIRARSGESPAAPQRKRDS
jgi:hypothetical protein